MRVKATTSFAGAEISMFHGEVCDVPDDIAAPLLECGYLEPVEAGGAAPGSDNKETSGQLTLEQLKKMKRADLNALAAENGIEAPESFKNVGELGEAIAKLMEEKPAGGSEE